MNTIVVRITALVRVTVAEGVVADRATVMLAADTAVRRGEAHSENINAEVISRDRALVGE